MRHRIRFRLFIFFVLVGSVFAIEGIAQGPLGTILARMEAHNKTLDTVQSNVTMLKTNTQLGETDTYIGTTSYIPKTSKAAKGRLFMRLDWEKPRVEQVAVAGDKYKLYKPSMSQGYEGQLSKAKNSATVGNAFGFINMSRDQLRANYNVSYLGEEPVGGVGTWHLLLTPKVTTSYKSSELWINVDGMPIQAKIVEQNNDVTVVTLQNIKKNVRLNTSIFDIAFPKGTNVIK